MIVYIARGSPAMIVYIARGWIDYEGADIIGVFETHEDAVTRCREVAELVESNDWDSPTFHRYTVDCWTLGAIMPTGRGWYWRPELDDDPQP